VTALAHLDLGDAARAFAARLLARHPEWASYVRAYEPVHPGDATPAGSLWLELPSPGDPAATLWLVLQDGEALAGLGDWAAEATFHWEPGEEDAAAAGILAFLDDVVAGRIVGGWRRHRFLWRTWETCQFRDAAEAAADRRVVRVSAWPPAERRRGGGA
jgi:hypothetical protein